MGGLGRLRGRTLWGTLGGYGVRPCFLFLGGGWHALRHEGRGRQGEEKGTSLIVCDNAANVIETHRFELMHNDNSGSAAKVQYFYRDGSAGRAIGEEIKYVRLHYVQYPSAVTGGLANGKAYYGYPASGDGAVLCRVQAIMNSPGGPDVSPDWNWPSGSV